MARLVVTAALVAGVALVAGATGAAHAAPMKRVRVETVPPGATVYLNAKEEGPACTPTPCNFDAPVGDQVLIVELAGHKPLFESLVVPARGNKGLSVSWKLDAAVGTVVVKGPPGAVARVDDADEHKLPARLELAAGDHTVTWTLNGKQLDRQPIKVEDGEELELTAEPTTVAISDDPPATREPGDIDAPPQLTRTAAPRRPRGRYFTIGAAFDVGYRKFTYDEPTTDNLPTETEVGQWLAGGQIELWPGTLAGVHVLRGLSLIVRYQHSINQQEVTGVDGMPSNAFTAWRSFEASARQRWTIKDKGALEVGAGFVRDQYRFEGDADAIKAVPDADYRAVRIGGRGSLLLGRIEPYVAAENRIVLPGSGELENRFELGASASGLRAALGLAARLGGLTARVEGSLTRYTWTFKPDIDGEFQAKGGLDSIMQASFVLGYGY